HDLVAWILSGTDDETRLEGFSGDHEWIVRGRRAAAHKMDNFQLVTIADRDTVPLAFRNDRAISFHRNTILGQIEMLQKLRDIEGRRQFLAFAIQPNLDFHMVRMLAH